MSNLIKAEIFKLQRNKTFWVIFGSVTGLSALLHFLIITDWWMVQGTAFDSAGLSELNALSTFTVPLFFNLIVSTLAGFFISIEFSDSGVIKNQMISGNKRSQIFIAKYLVFSLGAIIVTILIPLVTAVIVVILFGHGDILNPSNMMYLGRVYSLFILQFLGYTAIMVLLAIITEDSGKTIIFSILFTIVMFAVEKLVKTPFIELLYEHTIFYQFSDVFKFTMTNGEIIKSILVGVVSLIVIMLCGVFIINRKEIK
ncbi:ABC transporter permease [Virgibacillus profundi]|uniref:ABC transporter permease n=1 Tax=Virgibacillus profundi TaxID=2024555 RepID=A0A2A2IAZ2_9BACI|nr:ABC transporter permease [Virgibacillus profundi]PAV28290.1 ABC transporter permease [Virgibacillus profundi]PXY52594.1 ABC transporter permease [Virgibacillus profundi]